MKIVRYPTGKMIVRQHAEFFDAQLILIELRLDAIHSTAGMLSLRDMLSKVISMRYDSKWAGTAVSFITVFLQNIEDYNERQADPTTRITDAMKRTYLEQAISTSSTLSSVTDREHECIIAGGARYSFTQYVSAVWSKAQHIDSFRQTPSRTRAAHVSDLEIPEIESVDSPPGPVEELLLWEANRTKMALSTWRSLSTEAQTAWDTIQNTDKEKILGDKPRNDPPRTAAVSDVHPVSALSDPTADEDPTTEPLEAHAATSRRKDAIANAAPGDPRAVMSSAQPSKKTSFQVKSASFTPPAVDAAPAPASDSHLDAFICRYWDPGSSDSDTDDDVPDFR